MEHPLGLYLYILIFSKSLLLIYLHFWEVICWEQGLLFSRDERIGLMWRHCWVGCGMICMRWRRRCLRLGFVSRLLGSIHLCRAPGDPSLPPGGCRLSAPESDPLSVLGHDKWTVVASSRGFFVSNTIICIRKSRHASLLTVLFPSLYFLSSHWRRHTSLIFFFFHLSIIFSEQKLRPL